MSHMLREVAGCRDVLLFVRTSELPEFVIQPICATLRRSRQLRRRRAAAAGRLSMQESAISKLSTNLLSVLSNVLLVGFSSLLLLGQVSDTITESDISTKECECRCC
jgi:hypothetical protein